MSYSHLHVTITTLSQCPTIIRGQDGPHAMCPLVKILSPLFTMRRCASAVYAVVLCRAVRLSLTSRYCVKTANHRKTAKWRQHRTIAQVL